MNRSLFIPGICLLVAVGGIYQAEKTKVEAAANETTVDDSVTKNKRTRVTPEPSAKTESPLYNQLDDELLDGWPVLTRTSLMSRAGPSQRLYAKIRSSTSNDLAGHHFALKSLHVTADRKDHEFPLLIDHVNNRVLVFAAHQWHDYSVWRPSAIRRFMQLSGLKSETKSNENSISFQMDMGMDLGEQDRMRTPKR